MTDSEEVPLLHAEQARERIQQTHFPWGQFSIIFALQIAVDLTLRITYPFIPDVGLPQHHGPFLCHNVA